MAADCSFAIMIPVLLLVFIAAASALAADQAVYQYDDVVNKFYSIHKKPSEWRTASDICRQEGATLPSFPSIPDRILLTNIQYKNYNVSRPNEFDLWLDVEVPTQGPREQGVYLSTKGSVRPAAGSSQRLPFVCVRDGVDCDTAETGYTPGPNGVSCYKLHEAPPKPISWLGAFTECQAEGAHLAIPDDDSELEFIDSSTKLRRGKYWMAIGVNEFRADGVYRTLDGREMPVKFQKSVDTGVGGQCVYINDYSKLYTFPCESGHASYLCEKDMLRCRGINVRKAVP